MARTRSEALPFLPPDPGLPAHKQTQRFREETQRPVPAVGQRAHWPPSRGLLAHLLARIRNTGPVVTG